MSLDASIRAAVNSAFSSLTGITGAVSYASKSRGVYDPATGTTSGTTTTIAVPDAIVAGYSEQQIDGTVIQAGDRRVMIRADRLTAVTPTPDDNITFGGKAWEIVSMRIDPAAAVWIFQCRV